MNHIYRLVFNRTLGVLQVASEMTRAQGKASGRAGTIGAVAAPSSSIGGGSMMRLRSLAAAIALVLGAPVMADTTLVTGGPQTLNVADSNYDLAIGGLITGTAGSNGGDVDFGNATSGSNGGDALTGIDYRLTNEGTVVGGAGGNGGNVSVGNAG